MCDKAVEEDPGLLWPVPDHLKMQGMCKNAVEKDPGLLEYVPGQYKTQEMCDKAVEEDPGLLEYVPAWFVSSDWVQMRYDNSEYCDYDDEVNFFKWYVWYKKRKAQKASVKEELLPMAWHPSRYWNWLMSEDEKRKTEKNFLAT